jgi:hypothetical protein
MVLGKLNSGSNYNDKEELFDIQISKIHSLQTQVDYLLEEKRQLIAHIDILKRAGEENGS